MVTKPERVGLVERHPDPFPVRATAAGAAIVDGRRAERMALKRRPAKGPRGPWFSGSEAEAQIGRDLRHVHLGLLQAA